MRFFTYTLFVLFMASSIGCLPEVLLKQPPSTAQTLAPKSQANASNNAWKHFRKQPLGAQIAEASFAIFSVFAIPVAIFKLASKIKKTNSNPPPKPNIPKKHAGSQNITLFAQGETGPTPLDVVQPPYNVCTLYAFLYSLAHQRPERVAQITSQAQGGWNVALNSPDPLKLPQESVYITEAQLRATIQTSSNQRALWPELLVAALVLHLGGATINDIVDTKIEKMPPDRATLAPGLKEFRENGSTLVKNIMPDFWELFLGQPAFMYRLKPKQLDNGIKGHIFYSNTKELYQWLHNQLQNKRVITGYIERKYDQAGHEIIHLLNQDGARNGLITHHSYAVIGTRKESKDQYWIQLHNPNQGVHYGVCVQYRNNKMVEQAQAQCPDGNFELRLEDFIQHFYTITSD